MSHALPSEKITFFLDGKALEEATLTSMAGPIDFHRPFSPFKERRSVLETHGKTMKVWAYFFFTQKGHCTIQCYRKKPYGT